MNGITALTPAEESAISNFVHAFRDMTAQLGAAAEERYHAAPGSPAARGGGPDPTLDTVLDPSRVALNDAIRDAIVRVRMASTMLDTATTMLRDAHAPYIQD